jgi:phospholipid/cholesterol/gamma-HCH transport system permease protein
MSVPQALPKNHIKQPEINVLSADSGGQEVHVSGSWTALALTPRLAQLELQLGQIARHKNIGWDCSQIDTLDHLGAAILQRAIGARARAQLLLNPEHEALFRRLDGIERTTARHSAFSFQRLVFMVGESALRTAGHVRGVLEVLGAVAREALRLLARASDIPWREISANVYRTGAQALGITALVGFLIGVVLSYLMANQLKAYGADVFLVNILGISILRELGPVLAAILVAGRSGSAMTAQLGVMRVTQELDALSVMGIGYTRRLVLPKVVGLAIALPLLTVWTNALALLGGMAAARAELGISYLYFIDSLPRVVPIANLWLGVGKGAVFGVLIALLACHFGLRIRPNTESLGAGTTSSVVTAITTVILIDAAFAVAFRDVGLGF